MGNNLSTPPGKNKVCVNITHHMSHLWYFSRLLLFVNTSYKQEAKNGSNKDWRLQKIKAWRSIELQREEKYDTNKQAKTSNQTSESGKPTNEG